MKKSLLFLLLVVADFSFASINLQNELIKKVGNASVYDFWDAFSPLYTLSAYEESTIKMSGNFEINGKRFYECEAKFYNDTLYSVILIDSITVLKHYDKLDTQLSSQYHFNSDSLTSGNEICFFMHDVYKWKSCEIKHNIWLAYGKSEHTCLYVIQYLPMAPKYFLSALAEYTHLSQEGENPKNIVTSVAGVQFGDDIANVKRKISNRSNLLYREDSHRLIYSKTTLVGTIFDISQWYFGQSGELIAVYLYKGFTEEEKEIAETTFKEITNQYKTKYSNYQVKTCDKDIKLSVCGTAQVADGHIPIAIGMSHTKNEGYAIVLYYYHEKINNVYSDEI